MEITDLDKLAEIRRELKLRRRHYPKWIQQGKIDASHAARQVSIMAAIEFDYATKTGELRSLFDAPPEVKAIE